jgi:replicative DNA helicase
MSEVPFHSNEEESIVSLVIDFPELYSPIAKFITPDLFQVPQCQYVMAQIYTDFTKHGIIPSRNLLHARLAKQLTVDDPHEDILKLVNRKSDPREIPFLRENLHTWAENKTYELLYSDEALAAHQRGDNGYLQNIFDEAVKIRHMGNQGFWFFNQIDELFLKEAVEHIPTGFKGLDNVINEGGPSPGETVIWMASTGVGKSIMLCNQAVTGVLNNHNVLFVTFELSTIKTALRIAANMFSTDMNQIVDKHQSVRKRAVARKKSGAGDLVIYELAPGEHSVDSIYATIDNLKKTKGWTPKIVILDYLDLMVSRFTGMNDNDYWRQKSTANEIRGLAINEKVLVHSATQTNRSGVRSNNSRDQDPGSSGHLVDLDQVAESFGKAMPSDYVISLNQSRAQYTRDDPQIELFVAKNRNGPKFTTVTVDISYNLMKFREVL